MTTPNHRTPRRFTGGVRGDRPFIFRFFSDQTLFALRKTVRFLSKRFFSQTPKKTTTQRPPIKWVALNCSHISLGVVNLAWTLSDLKKSVCFSLKPMAWFHRFFINVLKSKNWFIAFLRSLSWTTVHSKCIRSVLLSVLCHMHLLCFVDTRYIAPLPSWVYCGIPPPCYKTTGLAGLGEIKTQKILL